MAKVRAAKRWQGMGQTSQVKACAVLKHSSTHSRVDSIQYRVPGTRTVIILIHNTQQSLIILTRVY
jgi:hypothetical protein